MATVRLAHQAEKDFDRLPDQYARPVGEALMELAAAPLEGKSLHGDYEGLRSLRVGTYRVVYTFNPRASLVEVIWIQHRSEAYRRAW